MDHYRVGGARVICNQQVELLTRNGIKTIIVSDHEPYEGLESYSCFSDLEELSNVFESVHNEDTDVRVVITAPWKSISIDHMKLAKKYGFKVIVEWHVSLFQHEMSSMINPAYAMSPIKYVKYIYKDLVDLVWVLNPYDLFYFSQFHHNVKMVHNTIDLPDITSIDIGNPIIDSEYILILSRFDPEKFIDVAIDIYSKSTSTKSEYKLVIVGTGTDEQIKYLKDLVDYYDLNDRVIFTGAKYGVDKYNLIHNCKFMWSMSPVENQPIIYIEAAAFGKRILALNNPSSIYNDNFNVVRYYLGFTLDNLLINFAGELDTSGISECIQEYSDECEYHTLKHFTDLDYTSPDSPLDTDVTAMDFQQVGEYLYFTTEELTNRSNRIRSRI
jgi:glycosyltransferase involved in cell wall biosynthesis